MKTKYGNIETSQIIKHKEVLQKDVFKLLWMKEENYPQLDTYFSSILWKLTGYNSIFNNQTIMIDIISILEAARIEANKENYSHRKYRKAILDSMSLIDKLDESDGD